MSSLTYLVENIETFIIDPLIILLFALALLLFLWGLAQFILKASSEEGKKEGKRHMLWGIIGIFIMVSVYGILRVLTNTFGIPF